MFVIENVTPNLWLMWKSLKVDFPMFVGQIQDKWFSKQ